MKSLRCLLGIHDYDAKLCTTCNNGWHECTRCGAHKMDVGKENHARHKALCENGN